MKILYISTRGTDFINEVLYSGFKELGINVQDVPHKPLYHAESSLGRLFIYDVDGHIIGEESTEDGMIHFRNDYFGSSRALKWECLTDRGKTYTAPIYGELDIDYYDEIIIGSVRRDNIALDIANKVYTRARERVILVDGLDDPFIRSSVRECRLYFKRELMKVRNNGLLQWFLKIYPRRDLNIKKRINMLNMKHTFMNVFYPPIPDGKNILPVNISVNNHKIDSDTGSEYREFDISFLCSPNTRYRVAFSEFLTNFARKEGLNVFVGNKPNNTISDIHMGTIPWKMYVDIIKSSKISVSLPGAGFDTARYWEIPYYGTALASPYLPIEIPNNFEDGTSAIFFNSFVQFANKAKKILHNDNWIDIGRNGKKIFTMHHTSKQRAQSVLNSIIRCQSLR